MKSSFNIMTGILRYAYEAIKKCPECNETVSDTAKIFIFSPF